MRLNKNLCTAKFGTYTDNYGNSYDIKSKCILSVKGYNNSIIVGKNIRNLLLQDEVLYIECNGNNSEIIINDNTTYGNDWKIVAKTNSRLFMGYDCMLSNEVNMYVHSNCSVKIGSHVWLGLRTAVISPAEIGIGSIVGACGVVNDLFSNNCILAGNPAKVIRKDISWHRSRDENNFFLIPDEYRCETIKEK